MEVRDGDPCGSKDARVIDVLKTTEAPENGHIEIRASPPKKVAGSIAQLKCIYINAHSMGNKWQEGAGSHCLAGKLCYSCHHGNTVG